MVYHDSLRQSLGLTAVLDLGHDGAILVARVRANKVHDMCIRLSDRIASQCESGHKGAELDLPGRVDAGDVGNQEVRPP